MFNVTNLNRFLLVACPCNAFYFHLPYNRFAHITFYTRSKRLLLTIIHCSQPRWPLIPRSLQLPHAFYTSMYLEVIAVLHYNNHDGVIHACVLKACISSKYSKCISAIKRILYTTAMYISSSSFVYLCFFLFTAMHEKSSALRVGVKTLHNTILF